MRHGKKIHKLERPKAHRRALMSNLASALITHGKIKTTEAKARALKPLVDKLITTSKQNTVHARRLVSRTVKGRETLKKLFDEIAPNVLNRTSGYSRIMRIGTRRGDGAQLVLVELVTAERKPEEKTRKGRKGWRKFGPRPKPKAVKETMEDEVSPVDEIKETAPAEQGPSEAEHDAVPDTREEAEKPASNDEKKQE